MAAWTPANLPGVALWWDASDTSTITVVDDAGTNRVSQWVDKVGGIALTGNTSADMDGLPEYDGDAINGITVVGFSGKRVLSFEGACTGITGTDQFTILTVHETNNVGVPHNFMRFGSDDGIGSTAVTWLDGFTRLESSGSQVFDDATLTNGDVIIQVVTATGPNGDNIAYHLNGTELTPLSTGNANARTTADESIDIGGGRNADISTGGFPTANQVSDAKVLAVVIVEGALSDVDRQRFEGWAAHLAGITSKLPASHPFKAAAPETGFSLVSGNRLSGGLDAARDVILSGSNGGRSSLWLASNSNGVRGSAGQVWGMSRGIYEMGWDYFGTGWMSWLRDLQRVSTADYAANGSITQFDARQRLVNKLSGTGNLTTFMSNESAELASVVGSSHLDVTSPATDVLQDTPATIGNIGWHTVYFAENANREGNLAGTTPATTNQLSYAHLVNPVVFKLERGGESVDTYTRVMLYQMPDSAMANNSADGLFEITAGEFSTTDDVSNAHASTKLTINDPIITAESGAPTNRFTASFYTSSAYTFADDAGYPRYDYGALDGSLNTFTTTDPAVNPEWVGISPDSTCSGEFFVGGVRMIQDRPGYSFMLLTNRGGTQIQDQVHDFQSAEGGITAAGLGRLIAEEWRDLARGSNGTTNENNGVVFVINELMNTSAKGHTESEFKGFLDEYRDTLADAVSEALTLTDGENIPKRWCIWLTNDHDGTLALRGASNYSVAGGDLDIIRWSGEWASGEADYVTTHYRGAVATDPTKAPIDLTSRLVDSGVHLGVAAPSNDDAKQSNRDVSRDWGLNQFRSVAFPAGEGGTYRDRNYRSRNLVRIG